jgi:uncharacterized protein (TIGR02271 family)
MTETIVAIFDSAQQAALAVHDLEAAGVPSAAITRHAKGGISTDSSATTATPEPGFWASLFGSEPEHSYETSVYDRSMEAGSTVVTVRTTEQHLDQVMDILERHSPIDIDERAATYGDSRTTSRSANPSSATAMSGTADGGTIQLSEETLAVGKRSINRGTTRVRRFVVETPMEQRVTLRDETVSVERRPVTDARPATDADFTDRVIEMQEIVEEAVVSKTAQVREEVVVRKEATERTETIRDTVRREDVEITKEPGGASELPSTVAPKI